MAPPRITLASVLQAQHGAMPQAQLSSAEELSPPKARPATAKVGLASVLSASRLPALPHPALPAQANQLVSQTFGGACSICTFEGTVPTTNPCCMVCVLDNRRANLPYPATTTVPCTHCGGPIDVRGAYNISNLQYRLWASIVGGEPSSAQFEEFCRPLLEARERFLSAVDKQAYNSYHWQSATLFTVLEPSIYIQLFDGTDIVESCELSKQLLGRDARVLELWIVTLGISAKLEVQRRVLCKNVSNTPSVINNLPATEQRNDPTISLVPPKSGATLMYEENDTHKDSKPMLQVHTQELDEIGSKSKGVMCNMSHLGI
ncbi:hypothetical protein C8F01DRAFT_1079794 [Mycena amicta]|nr:hypothetical protein C8F01DRAFT_1079794 [Mycena amicta]